MTIRVVAVTGLACTGSTTFAGALAEHLGWPVYNVGAVFRAYCADNAIQLDAVPITVHRQIDQRTYERLEREQHIVVEGRFLAMLARGIEGVLLVQTTARREIRTSRCAAREGLGGDLAAADRLLRKRDATDYDLASKLYGPKDFAAPELYDLVCSNEQIADIALAIAAVRRVVDHQSPTA